MNMAELLRIGEEELQRAGVEEFQLDARLLLQYCTGKSRTEIFLDSRSAVDDELEENYRALLGRRKDREPVAYIVGEREFWSLPFSVNPDVLIPRPETEFLVDRVLGLTDPENFARGHILDLCCGSGVIAAVLAHETGQKVIAADISAAALAVARKNVSSHNLSDLVFFVQASLLSGFR
ncbi:MAG: N5-glutamine methyltransferase family protein, partial [Desulforhopalus sp.]